MSLQVRCPQCSTNPRAPAALGPFPGRLIIFDVTAPRYVPPKDNERLRAEAPKKPPTMWLAGGPGRTIIRVYLAHGRVFAAIAAGRDFDSKQANVQRLFESVEILEPLPEPPPTPAADPHVVADYEPDLDGPTTIGRLRYSPDGKELVVGTHAGSAAWVSAESKATTLYRKPAAQVPPPQMALDGKWVTLGEPRTVGTDTNLVRAVGFTAGGRLVILRHLGLIRVVNPADGKLLAKGAAGHVDGQGHPVSLAAHPGRPHAAVGYGRKVRVVDLDRLPPP